eukprot:5897276-Amphidinium_carterae.1
MKICTTTMFRELVAWNASRLEVTPASLGARDNDVPAKAKTSICCTGTHANARLPVEPCKLPICVELS